MLFDSIGMCFEKIRIHSGSIMYFNRMQTCSESIPLHFVSIHVYLKACFLKAFECILKANEHILRAYECVWNVCDYRYISSFDVIRAHKAAMAFHMFILEKYGYESLSDI